MAMCFDFSLCLETSQVRVTHTYTHTCARACDGARASGSFETSGPLLLPVAGGKSSTCGTLHFGNRNPEERNVTLPEQGLVAKW